MRTGSLGLFLGGWIGGFLSWLGLRGLRLNPLQYGRRSAMPGRVDRQSNRSHHERHRRPSRRFGERTGGSAGPKRCLTALSSEGGGDVAALAALQQHDHDNEETDHDMDSSDQINQHDFRLVLLILSAREGDQKLSLLTTV